MLPPNPKTSDSKSQTRNKICGSLSSLSENPSNTLKANAGESHKVKMRPLIPRSTRMAPLERTPFLSCNLAAETRFTKRKTRSRTQTSEILDNTGPSTNTIGFWGPIILQLRIRNPRNSIILLRPPNWVHSMGYDPWQAATGERTKEQTKGVPGPATSTQGELLR